MVLCIRLRIMKIVELFHDLLDRFVAIKSFKQNDKESDQGCDHSVLREIVNLSRVKHKNILEIVNVHYNQSLEGNKYFLVFPYYEYDLYCYLKLHTQGDESFRITK